MHASQTSSWNWSVQEYICVTCKHATTTYTTVHPKHYGRPKLSFTCNRFRRIYLVYNASFLLFQVFGEPCYLWKATLPNFALLSGCEDMKALAPQHFLCATNIYLFAHLCDEAGTVKPALKKSLRVEEKIRLICFYAQVFTHWSIILGAKI